MSTARHALAVFAVLSAMSLVVLDAGIANLALPVMGRALSVAPAQAILVVTAYQAGLMMALLPAGALGERFGYRPVFAGGVALFAAASAACALAPSFAWLVAARLAQGLGGAAVMALGVALLRFTVRSDRLGAAISWNALTVALSAAAAPSLGAAVLSLGGWRALFAVNLPLALSALVAARVLPVTPRKQTGPGFVSLALNAAAFGLLILGVEFAPSEPILAASLAAGGVGALVLLVRREAPRPAPLIPLDLLRVRALRLSALASVCCFAGQGAGLLALPFLLQHELGLSPMTAGLYVTAWPLSVAATAIVAGRLSDRLPTAWLCAAGAASLAAGLAGAAFWPLGKEAGALLPFIMLSGSGFGLFQTPNNHNLFLSAPPNRSGAAGGLQGSARVTGQTLGGLTMTLLFSLTPIVSGPRVGLAVAAGLALLATLTSLLRTPAALPEAGRPG